MADELLPYYERELAYIRRMGAEFAKENPKIAGRLGINDDVIEDPHVSRLIESFAYLNARIQHKLNDDFPELTDGLLGVLFPHYLRPVPSMSIVQFAPDTEKLEAAYRVPRHTLLETEQFQGENCVFATGYEVDLHPIEIKAASLQGLPLTTPGAARMRGARSVLKLTFTTFTQELALRDVAPERVRLYLKGQPQFVNPLYQMLLKDCLGVVFAVPGDPAPPVAGPESLRAVGYAPDEGLLPYPPGSFTGYRLLTEYFVFPEKFMFIDLLGMDRHAGEAEGGEIDVYVYLGSADVELEHDVSAQTFQLNCAPVVNLFPHKADPVRIDQTRSEYQIVPEARRPLGYEVYAVERVCGSQPSGEVEEYHPIFGLNHDSQNHLAPVFWSATRRSAKLGAGERDEGTDVYLTLVDLNFDPHQPDGRTLIIDTICSNRDLPAKLPFSPTQPRLQCVDGAPPCAAIRLLTKPTATLRPPQRGQARWRLISHLNLNFLSLTGRDNGTEALKEILRLYDFRNTSVTRAQINAIQSVRTKPISAPLNIDGHTTLCRGLEVEVEIDDQQLAGSSLYLFASVLEHFFALYSTVNSFTRLLVRVKSQEGYLKRCPPRAGERVLL